MLYSCLPDATMHNQRQGRQDADMVKSKQRISVQGDVVKRFRESQGWTQGQLAQYSGVDQSQISKMESGNLPDIKLSTARALALTLGTSIDELAGLPRHRPKGNEMEQQVDLLLDEVGDLGPDAVASLRAFLRLLKEEKSRGGRSSRKGSSDSSELPNKGSNDG